MGMIVFTPGYLAELTAWETPHGPSQAADALRVASGYTAQTPEIWPLTMEPGEVRELPYATVRASLNADGISRDYRITRKLEWMVGREVAKAEPDRDLAAGITATRRRPAVAAEMMHYLGTVTAVKAVDGQPCLMVRDLLTGETEPVDPDTVRIAPDARDKARDLARAGQSAPDIAYEMGRPLRTIQHWCEGLLPPRGGRRLPDDAEVSRATRYRRQAEAREESGS